MWKLLKIIGHLIKALFWFVLLLACIAIALLYVLEHGMPQAAVKAISEKLSDEDIIVEIDRITFGINTGLHLHKVQAYPKKIASDSFGTAEDIIIKFSLAPGISNNERIQSVTLKNVDSPDHPRRIFRKLAEMNPDKRDEKEPRKPIPDLKPFKLIIENSHIVGFKTKNANAVVTLQDPSIKFSDITLKWPDYAREMQLTGKVDLNLESEMLEGYVTGEAYPANVTGFLTELNARTVLREIDRFSQLKNPIRLDCGFIVDLSCSDFSLDINLDLDSCAYRKVPLNFVQGNIKAYGTNTTTWVDIKELKTADDSGKLEGSLFYDESLGTLKIDALSTMNHSNVTTIIDLLTHGELAAVITEHPPVVTAKGIVAISTNVVDGHNMSGKFSTGKGSLFGLRVQKSSCDYSVRGNQAFLQNIKSTTPAGGDVTGGAVFTIRAEEALPPYIVSHSSFEKIDLTDLARIFNLTNARTGECSGKLELAGVLGTNQMHTLNGQGSFKIINSRINQLPLFAGLTEYMSKNIPGISSLVDQSACSVDFLIKNGIVSTDNFDIEGDVFNIHGKGTYDLVKNDIKFTVHVALFKKKSMAGKLSRIVTFPFKKLLLEFRVHGSPEDPDWSYVTILEKITDQIPSFNKKDKNE